MPGRPLKVLLVNPSWDGLVSHSSTSVTIGTRSSTTDVSCSKRRATATTDVISAS